jgi:hypothetical protein
MECARSTSIVHLGETGGVGTPFMSSRRSISSGLPHVCMLVIIRSTPVRLAQVKVSQFQ